MGMKLISGLVAGLAMGAAATYYVVAMDPQASSDPVLALSGKNYTMEQLPPAAAQAMHDVNVQAWIQRQQILMGAAGELYLQDQVKKTGNDRETVMADLLGIEEPSDEDLKAFYDENKGRIPAGFDQVREQIRGYLMGQDVQMKRDVLLERLRKEEGLDVLLPEPEAPLNVIDTEGFPAKGNANARTTIVKFADYQCPHCKDAALTLDALVEEMGDKVKLVYIDFPINNSGISRAVALGAVCADEQGKYWEYNSAAYKQQSTLNNESPIALAKLLSLNEETFAQCMASDRPEEKVAKGEAEAERLGLTGTPAIFVNGKAVRPSNLHDGLKATIKKVAHL